MNNFLNRLLGKTAAPDPVEVKAVADGMELIAKKVRPMVLDFMLTQTKQDWEVSFIDCEWQTRDGDADPCLVVKVYTPFPGKVIGIQGETARALSSFIGAKLKIPIYSKGIMFEPFRDSLPK